MITFKVNYQRGRNFFVLPMYFTWVVCGIHAEYFRELWQVLKYYKGQVVCSSIVPAPPLDPRCVTSSSLPLTPSLSLPLSLIPARGADGTGYPSCNYNSRYSFGTQQLLSDIWLLCVFCYYFRLVSVMQL